MRPGSWFGMALAAVCMIGAPALGTAGNPPLDELLERFDATPRSAPKPSVSLDAWIEADGARRAVVVVIEPEGETRLIADPGITVMPVAQGGVEWLVPLPHRHVDPSREYFGAQAAVRLPFAAEDGRPLELLVEYAYCVVDVQCFFGEETLRLENRIN